MNYNTVITNRFANTTIKTRLRNVESVAKEGPYFAILPRSAFITGFIMEIEGKNYSSFIDEKQKVMKTYNNVSH